MHNAISGIHNLVVAHFKDGRTLKGKTHDFMPARGSFHLIAEDADDEGETHEIQLSDLKAVFFVKTLEGKSGYQEKKKFEEVEGFNLRGLKISVEFADGEVIRGVTLGYNKDKPGFFVIPVDENREHCTRRYLIQPGASASAARIVAERNETILFFINGPPSRWQPAPVEARSFHP